MSFTDRLDGVSLPKGFTLRQFAQFNGTGDPINHLQGFFGAKMAIKSNDPDIYAKTFSNNLTDRALDWGQSSKKPNYDPMPQKGLVHCTRPQTVESVTLLRVSIAEVYAQIDDKNLLPKLVRMRIAPGRMNKSRYCEYHREHGHATKECRVLQEEIEKLIKRGYLKEFVEKGTHQDASRHNHRSPPPDNHPRVKREPQEMPRITGRIDTIS
ncbi:hypothetical protein LIER_21188 [Lithospermum erythrorhizon]|uniref:Retrotransposon gag domain-containing protein n=1 Tax=Lithospermum erythrorhizon TaxID=34254 RepID=A0AAV3QQJ4_LITER